MSYIFKQNLVASSKYSIKCPYSMKPEYVTIHDTANKAPASNEISYMIGNGNQVSFHIAVDEKEVIQGLPLDRNSWSCGDGGNGSGNRKGISLEICRPTNENRALYDQAEENAVYVSARLLHKFGLGIDRLKKHQDWSGKKCPNVILREGRWEGFKGRVEWVLNEIKAGRIDSALESGTTGLKPNSAPAPTNTPNASTGDFLVEIICNELNIRKEASFDSAVVGVVKKGNVFTIVEEKNGLGKLKSGAGWISMGTNYVKRKDSVATPSPASTEFKVQIICNSLNIREKADFNSKVVGTVSKGDVFTIVEENNGLGKLKSGAGWISLGKNYVKRI